MNIKKWNQFITENLNDTPESYINTKLSQLKSKIDKLFDFDSDKDGDFSDREPEDLKKKNSDPMSFKDLGVELESSEISKYSQMYDSLTFKFSDSFSTYTLIVMIDIKEGIPENPDTDFDIDDIKKCYIKFKKYDLNTLDIIGQLSKNIDIKEIDEDFIIKLKIEIDDKFGDEEEFKIETE